jgi:hypothetical protein
VRRAAWLALALAGVAFADVGDLLRYKPTKPLAYRLADLERVERQVRSSVAAPMPKPEVHTYRTDKRYRWQVAERKGGLAVKLDVVSSKMAMDGTTVPKDLGGHSGEDWIDDRGLVHGLGQVEDPIRLEASLPMERVQPGDSWTHGIKVGHALQVNHDAKFVEARTVSGVRCVRLEIKAEGDGVDTQRGVRVLTRSTVEVDFDPVRGVVVAADVKARLEETSPPKGEPLSRVVRVTRRKVALEGESR